MGEFLSIWLVIVTSIGIGYSLRWWQARPQDLWQKGYIDRMVQRERLRRSRLDV